MSRILVCVCLQPFIAAVYNLNTNNYRYFPMMDSPFCAGNIRLIDDTILIVGGDNIGLQPGFGDGRYSIRVFTPGARPNYVTTDTMQPYFSAAIDPNSGARWYPTLLTMPDGNVLIASGATTDGTTSLLSHVSCFKDPDLRVANCDAPPALCEICCAYLSCSYADNPFSKSFSPGQEL